MQGPCPELNKWINQSLWPEGGGFLSVKMKVLVAQMGPTLWNPMDCNPPASSVRGILQARILEWVAIPFSRASSRPKDWTQFSCIAGRFFTIRATAAAAKSLQSCPTLCDPTDCCPPGSPSLGFSRQEHWSGLPFLLQCMKVKSESEVSQLCLTLSDPVDCSPPGSSIHGIFQARVLEWGAIAFSNQSHYSQINN